MWADAARDGRFGDDGAGLDCNVIRLGAQCRGRRPYVVRQPNIDAKTACKRRDASRGERPQPHPNQESPVPTYRTRRITNTSRPRYVTFDSTLQMRQSWTDLEAE
jgi:hypothetical protein